MEAAHCLKKEKIQSDWENKKKENKRKENNQKKSKEADN